MDVAPKKKKPKMIFSLSLEQIEGVDRVGYTKSSTDDNSKISADDLIEMKTVIPILKDGKFIGYLGCPGDDLRRKMWCRKDGEWHRCKVINHIPKNLHRTSLIATFHEADSSLIEKISSLFPGLKITITKKRKKHEEHS